MHKDDARTSITRYALILIGIILLCLPVLALLFPGLFSYKWNNLLFGDITLLAEGGIIALIAALEQPYKQSSLSLPAFSVSLPKIHIPIINFPEILSTLSTQVSSAMKITVPKIRMPTFNVLEITESVSKIASNASHALKPVISPSHRTRTEP